jgi:PAT family beta-lactamase induction signal transducer AmpG
MPKRTLTSKDLSLSTKLTVVGVLFFGEGVPYGFVLISLAFFLRGRGVPLEHIGVLSLLGLAWSFKVLWSPLADRYGSRAAWMVPAQLVLFLCLVYLTLTVHHPITWIFWVVVAVLCLASATQDLVVDAYTIELLETKELGLGNGVRNGAYRAGVLVAGSGLLVVSDYLGWQNAFAMVAGIMLAIPLTVLLSPPFRLPRPVRVEEAGAAGPAGKGGFHVLTAFRGLYHLPYFWAVIFFTLTYKAGDATLGPMVSPFWKDMGFSGTQFGLVSGGLGALSTIVGGVLGGLFITRFGIGHGLWALGIPQAVSNLGYYVAALPGMAQHVLFYLHLPLLGTVPVYPIYLASQGENFASGMGSAAFMAFLMSLCDKRFCAMQYAFLAMLFAFGARIFGFLGGLLAGAFGYATFFLITFFMAFPAYALLPWILPLARQRESLGEPGGAGVQQVHD